MALTAANEQVADLREQSCGIEDLESAVNEQVADLREQSCAIENVGF
jgi:hypothetical protein